MKLNKILEVIGENEKLIEENALDITKNLEVINEQAANIFNIVLFIDKYECRFYNPCKNEGLCTHKDGHFNCDCNGTGYGG